MAEASTVSLHIGHGKTGSSYVQATFRKSAAAIRDEITYVLPDRDRDLPDQKITSGFGRGFLAGPRVVEGLLRSGRIERGGTYFVSSEYMFEEIVTDSGFNRAFDVLRGAGLTPRVLLFIRNPVDGAASMWQQGVKRSGWTSRVDEFFGAYETPTQVARCIDNLAASGVDLTIRNYSVHHRAIAETVCSWLALESDRLIRPGVATINRTLTPAECEMQRRINVRRGGPAGSVFADVLCEALPDLRSELTYPPTRVQQELWNRQLRAIERVNAAVPPEEQYRLELRAETPHPRLEFEDDQAWLIAGQLAELARRRRVLPGLATIAARLRRSPSRPRRRGR